MKKATKYRDISEFCRSPFPFLSPWYISHSLCFQANNIGRDAFFLRRKLPYMRTIVPIQAIYAPLQNCVRLLKIAEFVGCKSAKLDEMYLLSQSFTVQGNLSSITNFPSILTQFAFFLRQILVRV